MKNKIWIVLCVILLILSSCGSTEISETSSENTLLEPQIVERVPEQPQSLREPDLHESQEIEAAETQDTEAENFALTVEDYIAVLEDLRHAFATGEYQEFVTAYPLFFQTDGDWPLLLEGVTAEMSFNADEIFFGEHGWLSPITVHLNVSNGNRHLPSGEQTLRLYLSNTDERQRNIALYGMVLNTDGRIPWPPSTSENPTLEDQVMLVTSSLSSWARSDLERTIVFLSVFESNAVYGYTEEEMILGAKKYLGLADFSPSETYAWTLENTPPNTRICMVEYRDGRYQIMDFGWGGIHASMLLLDSPSQGDLTVRMFHYANMFRLEVREIADYNFRILQGVDGTQYAQLLSVQVENF